jgi:replicative DNA helicase
MKTTPFDVSFQDRLVRLMYQDPGFGEAALEHLKPSHFDNRAHAWTVRTMKHLLAEHGTLPDLLMLNRERRKAEAFGTVSATDQPALRALLKRRLKKPVPNRSYVKRELHTFVHNQLLKSFFLESVDKHLPKQDWDAINGAMTQLLDLDLTGDYSLGVNPAEDVEERIRTRAQEKEEGITTGVDELDRIMRCGGLTSKQLGVTIAPTGRGKTNWLINVAAAAVLEGVPTLYVTLELDEATIVQRMDARFTGVPINLLESNPEEVRKGWKRVRKRVGKNLRVKYMPPGTSTVAAIKQHIRRLERHAFYPKLLIVDYADLLKPSVTFSDSSYETQGQAYLDLLGLLAQKELVGWTATQGNRKSMDAEADGELDLSMMADSVKKAFLAYVVVGLAQSVKEKKLKRMRAVVLKNRNGPSDKELLVKVDHSIASFKSFRVGGE